MVTRLTPATSVDRGRLWVVARASMTPMHRELAAAAWAAGLALGLDAVAVESGDERGEPAWLLGIGPDQAYRDDLARATGRPGLTRIAWTGEPMVDPGTPNPGVGTALARSRAVSYVKLPPALRGMPLPGPLGKMRRRVRNQKELGRNARLIPGLAALADRVVVTNRDLQAILRDRGVTARVVPFGWEPSVHGPLTPAAADRDLDLVSLAHYRDPLLAARRTAKIRALMEAEPRLLGAEEVWGDERNALLRRTRVVVNVQRVEGTFIGLRIVLALAAGAAVVTEPMTDPHPFVPGVHFVDAASDDLLDSARALLADERRRREIVEAGQDLLTNELSMTRSLARVLAD
jgi:hypothetical protein